MNNQQNKKVLNIKTSESLHRKVYAIAAVQGVSLNEAVNAAIRDYVEKNGEVVLNLFGGDEKSKDGEQN